MNQKKNNDVAMGLHNEAKVLKYLNHKNRFNHSLQKTENTYDSFDFINDEYICELKSRRVHHNQYVSAMCGLNKIRDIKKYGNRKVRFYWLFTDGLYYWDYKKNNPFDYENNEYYTAQTKRNDRGYAEVSHCCYVWNKFLKKATSRLTSV